MNQLHLSQFLVSFALALATVSSVQAQKPAAAMPSNWADWQASRLAGDLTMIRQIDKLEWWQVCTAWGRETRTKGFSRRSAALRDKLVADNMINGVDLGSMRLKVPEIGQTACGVFAVMGQPDTVNYTSRANSQSSQMVYRDKQVYVYTTSGARDGNGIVSSVQH